MQQTRRPISLLVATICLALFGFGIGRGAGSRSGSVSSAFAAVIHADALVLGHGGGGSFRDAVRTWVERRDRVVWAERNQDEEAGGRHEGDGGTTGLALRLVPAPGVTLPSGSFTAGAVRFNDLGEVVEILPARSEPCDTFWIQDTGDPETWIVVCLGSCPPDEGACTVQIDLTTLEISCGCP